MPSEFALIDQYFKRPTSHTLLGVGDDGALIAPTPGQELVVSTDLLVEGTHFLADTDAEALGWKCLAVNVSDLAAMGAQPRWALLAAVLPAREAESPACKAPAPTHEWIEAFARGFFACAQDYGIDLIGGDTTRGPRAFCVTILGEAPAGQALRRSGAKAGDSIWVSGRPGRAALGLAHLQGRTTLTEPQLTDCLAALHRPQPRVALGLALRGLATAAIDVSDGLLADLGHILEQSALAARLQIPNLPAAGLERDCLLSGGDDYELLFTAPAASDERVAELAGKLELPLTRIGEIVAGAPGELVLNDDDGSDITPARRGYDHFAPQPVPRDSNG
ncbi:thiamine-phosphate kinase [Sulfuritalea sp.]|uniref:thiamine-phosphate kinase n=1 Tax=Sulfuritalea sp. TaxID=2480090 RepID=UPI00286E4E7C|nr:thiamine-phosphate kinase [Sulfuritalea sp.]